MFNQTMGVIWYYERFSPEALELPGYIIKNMKMKKSLLHKFKKNSHEFKQINHILSKKIFKRWKNVHLNF